MSSPLRAQVVLYSVVEPVLLVLASTGVVYTNQTGGYSCNQRACEGFLVPLETPGKVWSALERWDNFMVSARQTPGGRAAAADRGFAHERAA